MRKAVLIYIVFGFVFMATEAENITECSNNWYIKDNTCEECGFCLIRNQTQCNKNTGKCRFGCQHGYSGEACHDKCRSGTFGRDCTGSCSKCLNNECNYITGVCPECPDGYIGQYCKSECPNGTYGSGCSSICLGCKDVECSKTNGRCQQGCVKGFHGAMCDKDCNPNMYGAGCNSTCGHCKLNQCYSRDGRCFGECEDGYVGVTCQIKERSYNMIIIYSVVGVIVVILVVIIVLFCIKRRKNKLKHDKSLLKLQHVQRRLDGYTTYPLSTQSSNTDDANSQCATLEPQYPELRSSITKRQTDGSTSSDNMAVVLKPDYVDVIDRPESTASGYIEVYNNPHKKNNLYENFNYKPLSIAIEVYENPLIDSGIQADTPSHPTSHIYENLK